jgi:hypothetical protein
LVLVVRPFTKHGGKNPKVKIPLVEFPAADIWLPPSLALGTPEAVDVSLEYVYLFLTAEYAPPASPN